MCRVWHGVYVCACTCTPAPTPALIPTTGAFIASVLHPPHVRILHLFCTHHMCTDRTLTAHAGATAERPASSRTHWACRHNSTETNTHCIRSAHAGATAQRNASSRPHCASTLHMQAQQRPARIAFTLHTQVQQQRPASSCTHCACRHNSTETTTHCICTAHAGATAQRPASSPGEGSRGIGGTSHYLAAMRALIHTVHPHCTCRCNSTETCVPSRGRQWRGGRHFKLPSSCTSCSSRSKATQRWSSWG